MKFRYQLVQRLIGGDGRRVGRSGLQQMHAGVSSCVVCRIVGRGGAWWRKMVRYICLRNLWGIRWLCMREIVHSVVRVDFGEDLWLETPR